VENILTSEDDSVNFYQTTRRRILEDGNLYNGKN
jgi:hypothetical protein